jgi:DNA-binding transcriptional LysR family regulator
VEGTPPGLRGPTVDTVTAVDSVLDGRKRDEEEQGENDESGHTTILDRFINQVHLLFLHVTDKVPYMIDVRRLEILREFARCGTVAATAEAVHLTASAVSQQLAALSREAGTPMLEPDGRRVRLTAAAEMLLAHAHEIFTHLEHAEADLAAFRAGHAGTVSLGGFPTSIRALAVPAISAVADRSGVRVRVMQVAAEEAADALLAREIDVAMTLVRPGTAIGGLDPRLTAEHLLDDILDLVLPVEHPLAGQREVELAKLSDADWVGFTGGYCWQVTEAACARAGFAPRVVHVADDDSAVMALVSAGDGVATVPRLAQAPKYLDPVVVRPVAGPPPIRRIAMQYRAGTAAQPHIAPLLAVLRELAAKPWVLLHTEPMAGERTA